MFEIFKDKTGNFRFRLKEKSGHTILSSESYTQKTNCQKGVSSVKRNSKNEDRFELKQASNKKWYFNLKAGNGQVVGTSDHYDSEASVKNAVKTVADIAPGADTVDLSK
ncbi:YegP family protein [Apibacter raozihei]|uniref:YegP family protein n=1 Tax=Apibacter TaxID=1778601 RepID=UPI000FE30CBE|nr:MULTISPECIES: YegP family protein [Apibacter]